MKVWSSLPCKRQSGNKTGAEGVHQSNMTQAGEPAQAANVVFYGIRYTEEHHGKLTTRNKDGTSVVDRMAVEAGGIHIDARVTDPHEHLRRIEEELQTSYWGEYYRRIKVRMRGFGRLW